MKNKLKFLGIIAVVAMMGLSMTSCMTTDNSRERSWADQTMIPNKDFVVLGAVVLRDTNERTVIADLMDAAIEMGGHDIINVRLTHTTTTFLGLRMSHDLESATAVVIAYTEETLRNQGTSTLLSDGNQATSAEFSTIVLEERGGGGLFGGGAAGGSDRGFLGGLLSRIPLIGRLF